MKRLGMAAFMLTLVAVFSFVLVGCGSQTFDDIAYESSEQTALDAVRSFNNAKTGMLNKIVEYETTDIKETLVDSTGTIKTVKTVTINKFGRLLGTNFTQKTVTTYDGGTENYVTVTQYNGK